MIVTAPLAGADKLAIELGAAHAYIDGTKADPHLTVRLFNKVVTDAKECGSEDSSPPKSMTEPTSLELRTAEDDGGKSVRFGNAPGKIEGVGYTLWYVKKGSTGRQGSGSQPGGAGDEGEQATLEISALDDKVLRGCFTWKSGDESGTADFTAQVCERELSDK